VAQGVGPEFKPQYHQYMYKTESARALECGQWPITPSPQIFCLAYAHLRIVHSLLCKFIMFTPVKITQGPLLESVLHPKILQWPGHPPTPQHLSSPGSLSPVADLTALGSGCWPTHFTPEQTEARLQTPGQHSGWPPWAQASRRGGHRVGRLPPALAPLLPVWG
jgi:hypothetical protein